MAPVVLTCPKCGGTRIAQQLQAAVLYLVEYVQDEYGYPAHFQITEPADVVAGHAQYEITGGEPDLYCQTPDCGYDSANLWDFVPNDEEEE